MRARTLLTACLIGVLVSATWFATVRAEEPRAKSTYLIIYRPGPAWLAGKPVSQQPLKEHFAYMLDLYEQGTMKFAGPFTDDTGGAVLLEVDNEEQAKSVVANDPAVKTKVMTPELRPWRLVTWDQQLLKRKAASASGSSRTP